MAKKLINWRTKGMNRDTSPSAFSPEFAFENRNIRLSTNEGNTQMSWVNERGTKKIYFLIDKTTIPSDSINGTVVGTAVINHKLVLFISNDQNEKDIIYVLEKAKTKNSSYDLKGKKIYDGILNFNSAYPLETLVNYESKDIQKVYWTDNLNPPRVINIASEKGYQWNGTKEIDTQLDFNPALELKEEVKVEKMYGVGEFPAGIIQYAFTYYNKYMQESAIFYTTPLYYISYKDRGGSPENTIANSFKIKIKNVDRNFEYLRIYSILRTSKNTTPLCKRVADLSIAASSTSTNKVTKNKSNLDDFGKTMSVSHFAQFSQDNGSCYVQGAACYDKYLFQGYIGGKYIDIINLKTNQKVGTLETDISLDFSKYHGNVLSFGKDIAEGSDFPYLYYSAESNNAPCMLVIKINHSDNVWSGKVVQRIYLPKCEGGKSQNGTTTSENASFTHYYQNGCVDAENKCIWVSGYTMNTYWQNTDSYVGNMLIYRKYPLPEVSSGDCYFSYSDVKKSFLLPFRKGTQGMVITDNKLYQCFGYDKGDIYDEYLDCIDLDGTKVIHSYNFPKEQLKGLGEELESPYIYNGNLYLSATCYDWKYYTLWNISFSGNGEVDVDPVNPSKPDEWDNSKCDIVFVDTGTQGETVDPTELLYKEGQDIIVKTMEQKDGTLFLGNIYTKNGSLPKKPKSYLCPEKMLVDLEIKGNEDSNIINTSLIYYQEPDISVINTDNFPYINSIGVSGFKSREYYRIGIQFQYKTGRWSEPVWLKDYQINGTPGINDKQNTLTLPQITVYIGMTTDIIDNLVAEGYKRARLLMAQPTWNDRTILCQGIANSCIYRDTSRYIEEENHYINTSKMGNLYGQSSWIFRPKSFKYDSNTYLNTSSSDRSGAGQVPSSGNIISLEGMEPVNNILSPGINSIEVGTATTYNFINSDDKLQTVNDPFKIDKDLITIHSPETVFEDSFKALDWSKFNLGTLGSCVFSNTYGDIDIQTKTPTIGSAEGFTHRSITTSGTAALISGLYYSDFIVDEKKSTDPQQYEKYNEEKVPVLFPIYMWHKNGALNNDVSRDGRSSELLKKKICNYHLSIKTIYTDFNKTDYTADAIDYFNSEELSILKLNNKVYMGNIDTMITPKIACSKYFVGNPDSDIFTVSFYSKSEYKLGYKPNSSSDDTTSDVGIYKYNKTTSSWERQDKNIGDAVTDLCSTREGVRIKYKSTPHIVVLGQSRSTSSDIFDDVEDGSLPIVEIYKDYNDKELYGGKLTDALKANTWIPISDSVLIKDKQPLTITSNRGDTWYQRYECLKTYPFTSEDVNQVIDIASFMIETHINIDGRYDRNRGQINNLNVSPKNFNLINPVYSQLDNFFNYKILDEDDYKNTSYPNQITWSKTKESGNDTDVWTNITLAGVLELDGDKGSVNKLAKLNNQLICFQDKGISQILYNENAQVSTTAGVPIELANSGKVQGKRYYTNTVGCSNKWSVVQTPAGIYFMDSNDKGIYLFNGELKNITMAGGFNTWAKQNIPSTGIEWNPVDFNNFVSYYDAQNQEVLFINKNEALAFSEKFMCFTSFYDYGNAPYLCNLDDISIWVKNKENNFSELWQHQAGKYCNFFDVNKGYSMTLIGNPEPTTDKTFTNLEFRACIEGEGTYDKEKDKFSPTLPFDSLEVWDEYQHGILNLSDRNGHDRFTHGNADNNASLNRKFRMWRCDIPRDNAPIDEVTEGIMGIKRFKVRPLDRMRNPWLYLKLEKKAATEGEFLSKVEMHDIIGTYFS